MSKHIELSVEVNPIWTELISEILIKEIGCSGVVTEETNYKDEEITSSSLGIVKGYLWFNEKNPPDVEELQITLHKKKYELTSLGVFTQDSGSWNLSVKEIADEEWAHSWKRFWHPMKIGNKIVICPSWEEYTPKEDEIIIDLDPGTAFGTGSHPTTRLCIVALEKYTKSGDLLADIGTGSGILAIAGIKFGAMEAVGDDNDPSVIEVAKENAQKNGVLDKCNFFEGSASEVKGEYDIVTANILAHILIEMMDKLAILTKKGGKLILSGIIAEKAEDVRQSAISTGLKIIETLDEDNWVAIVAEK